jgi:hypothetical protein
MYSQAGLAHRHVDPSRCGGGHYLLLTSYYLLLTAHYSLLTTHYSLLTTHYLLLTAYYSLLTTHYSLLTTHYLLLTTHSSLLMWRVSGFEHLPRLPTLGASSAVGESTTGGHTQRQHIRSVHNDYWVS